jgi:DNA-binding NarL/FixJ family response regulator
MKINIAITDDATLFRKGLTLLLEDFNDIDVILEANNGQELLDQLAAATTLPDVIILDLQMPVLDGVDTAKILREEYENIKIIVLSSHYSKAFILNMIEVGASAYLAKNTSPNEFATTIQNVHKNGFHYNQEVWAIIQKNLTKKEKVTASFVEDLTKRELEILQLLCEQHTSTEIAEKLFISKRTVEGHRNNLLNKLNCRNIAGLVVYAIQNQLVKIKPNQFW